MLTLKQELKKLILQNLAKKITTANIKKKAAVVAKKVFAGSTHLECTKSTLLQHPLLVGG